MHDAAESVEEQLGRSRNHVVAMCCGGILSRSRLSNALSLRQILLNSVARRLPIPDSREHSRPTIYRFALAEKADLSPITYLAILARFLSFCISSHFVCVCLCLCLCLCLCVPLSKTPKGSSTKDRLSLVIFPLSHLKYIQRQPNTQVLTRFHRNRIGAASIGR